MVGQMADATDPTAGAGGTNPGGRTAPEGGAGGASDPPAQVAAAQDTGEVKPAVRRRWEEQGAKTAREQLQRDLMAKTGGVPVEDILTEWTRSREEQAKAAEASQTEIQRVTKKHAAAEAALAAEKTARAEAERELRGYRLERPLRELVASVQVRKPHYAAVILDALKSRCTLADDGRTVHALGDDGKPDPDISPATVLSQIVADFPDLVTTPLPGHGSGPAHPAAPAAGTPGTNGRAAMTRDEERSIFAGLLKR